MTPSTGRTLEERRVFSRRSPKGNVQVECYMNALGLGPNVALSLFDVSQAGARVTVKAPLTPRQQIEIGLSGVGHRRPVKNRADVVWCNPSAGGTFQAGLKFQRYLLHRDLLELAR